VKFEVYHTPQFIAEVEESVELNLYFPCLPIEKLKGEKLPYPNLCNMSNLRVILRLMAIED